MSIPLPNFSHYECRNETLEVYASDRRGTIEYKFNNLGYRNNIDYVDCGQPIAAYIGSSLTSAIGVPWDNGFCYLSSKKLNVEPWNFSQGCTYLNNKTILDIVESLVSSHLNIQYWVVQFIDFDRLDTIEVSSTDLEKNSQEFVRIFNKIEDLLKDKSWCFLCVDRLTHNVPDAIRKHPKCVAWNFPFIDMSGVGTHPGQKWHNVMSVGIAKKLLDQ
jgi:hypothetical protein